jgi:hypothetical protein
MSNRVVVSSNLSRQTIRIIKAMPVVSASIASIEALDSDITMSVNCTSIDWLNKLLADNIEYNVVRVDYNHIKNQLLVVINYFE